MTKTKSDTLVRSAVPPHVTGDSLVDLLLAAGAELDDAGCPTLAQAVRVALGYVLRSAARVAAPDADDTAPWIIDFEGGAD